MSVRLKMGAEALLNLFCTLTGENAEFSENGQGFLFSFHSKERTCALAMGFLQEGFYRLGGGRFFQIEEQECQLSGGHACTLLVRKTPLS